MKTKKRYKQILGLLLSAAICLSGCSGSGSELILENEHGLSSDSSTVNNLTGGTVAWEGSTICIPGDDSTYADDTVTASAALAFSLDDPDVWYAKNVYKQMNPASLTVLFTAYTVLKNRDLADEVTVTKEDVKGLQNASTIGLEAGDVITVEQLLYGMLLCSGIDAANALARDTAGDRGSFVSQMNSDAKLCGCTGTHFANPNGLTESDHYTTAYDIYLVLHKLIQDERFLKIISTAQYHAVYNNAAGERVEKDYQSTVSYLQDNQTTLGGFTIAGGKTGTTASAGNCLALILEDSYGNYDLAIVLKAATKDSLYEQIEYIVDKIKN